MRASNLVLGNLSSLCNVHREVRADLSDIGVAGKRVSEGKGRQLGMKVKGHRLFYLLDRGGDFPNPKLFDTLIGARKM